MENNNLETAIIKREELKARRKANGVALYFYFALEQVFQVTSKKQSDSVVRKYGQPDAIEYTFSNTDGG